MKWVPPVFKPGLSSISWRDSLGSSEGRNKNKIVEDAATNDHLSSCPLVLEHWSQEETENKQTSIDWSNRRRTLAGLCTVKLSGSDRRLLNKCSAPAELRDPQQRAAAAEGQVACWCDLGLEPDTWAGGHWGSHRDQLLLVMPRWDKCRKWSNNDPGYWWSLS